MPAPTVDQFRAHRWGRVTLDDDSLFGQFEDAAIEDKLERAYAEWKPTAAGTILLAAHLLAVEDDAVRKIADGFDTVDLGSGSGLITDEMDGGTQRAVYRQANRRNRAGAEDDVDAHLLTTPFGRAFHFLRSQYARKRRRFMLFV